VFRKPFDNARYLSEAGVGKTRLSLDRMLILAILAGAYVAFGAQLAITVTMDLSPVLGVGLTNLIAGVVFSVGLILVVLGGAELFTGNNLILLSFWSGRTSLKNLLKSWGIVYIGNFIGSLLLVYLIFAGGLYILGGNSLGLRAIGIANAKVNLGFNQLIIRGILCNWLVCLAVWIANSSDEMVGKILGCVIPVTAFVASGFEHSVANMFFVPMGILLKGVPELAAQSQLNLSNLSWGSFIANNLIPVTIGNIIGGGLFVATLYWYVYLREEEKEKSRIILEQFRG
jgi:formate/nitrite transporter